MYYIKITKLRFSNCGKRIFNMTIDILEDPKYPKAKFEPNTVLYNVNEDINAAYIVRDGEVKLTAKSLENNEETSQYFGPNQILGLPDLLFGSKYSNTATVVTPASITVLPVEDFKGSINLDDQFLQAIERYTSFRIQKTHGYFWKNCKIEE